MSAKTSTSKGRFLMAQSRHWVLLQITISVAVRDRFYRMFWTLMKLRSNEVAGANSGLREWFVEKPRVILSLWPGVARLGRSTPP